MTMMSGFSGVSRIYWTNFEINSNWVDGAYSKCPLHDNLNILINWLKREN